MPRQRSSEANKRLSSYCRVDIKRPNAGNRRYHGISKAGRLATNDAVCGISMTALQLNAQCEVSRLELSGRGTEQLTVTGDLCRRCGSVSTSTQMQSRLAKQPARQSSPAVGLAR